MPALYRAWPTAADIEALLDARESAALPERTRHLAFGDVAATWEMLQELGVAAIIDEVTGACRADAGASAGTCLALAAPNRLVAPYRPDVTQFATMISQLRSQYQAITAAAGGGAADMTVVFDAGQNSEDNLAQLAGTGLHYVGSVPASDCPDLTALPASVRVLVNQGRFGGLTAYDTRRVVYGTERRAILTHSPELHQSQARGFDGTTLARAGRKLDDLAATLARGKTRRGKDKVEAEIAAITRKTWVRRVITWQLDGTQPKDLRLTWGIDQAARAALEEGLFGKHVLITSHDDWPAAEVIAGYRSQSEAEFSFRQLKDPRVVSFSPMHRWTEHNIRVHVFTCVLALQLAHLTRRQADHAGLHLSVRELLSQLAGIEETVLIYPSTGGRPKARRMTTELTGDQQKLHQTFELSNWAPRS